MKHLYKFSIAFIIFVLACTVGIMLFSVFAEAEEPTLLLSPSPTPQLEFAVVHNNNSNYANLRIEPAGEVINTYPNGTRLIVMEKVTAVTGKVWYYVTVEEDNITGYIRDYCILLENEEETEPKHTYILNTNTGVFHKSGCSSIERMSPSNKSIVTVPRSRVVDKWGYKACKNCEP